MKTQSEFLRHINLHKLRVVKLGLELGKTHYPAISLTDLEDFLKLHDLSKTLRSSMTLKRYGYSHEMLPVERLLQFYGRQNHSFEQRLELQKLVSDINTIDENISRQFFTSAGIADSKTRSDFQEIEKVADLVDRSLDPIAAEEFGHPMILASEYISDLNLAKHSLWLEGLYPVVTKNLSY